MNHTSPPADVSANIPVEMSLVDFVFQTLINCGNRAPVVNAAAIKPITIIVSIGFLRVLLFVERYLGFAGNGVVQQRLQ
jgi:hypothetical protein